MKKIYHGKRKWEISGNSFFKAKGKSPFLVKANFSGIWEMTGIIEKIISWQFGISIGSQKIGNAQVCYRPDPHLLKYSTRPIKLKISPKFKHGESRQSASLMFKGSFKSVDWVLNVFHTNLKPNTRTDPKPN